MSGGGTPTLITRLGICAAICISSPMLTNIGLNYATDGGSLAEKFHPATILLCVALAILLLRQTGLPRTRQTMPHSTQRSAGAFVARQAGFENQRSASRRIPGFSAHKTDPAQRRVITAALLYVMLTLFLTAYIVCLNGYQGATILIENFLPAGVATILLLANTAQENRCVQGWIIWLIRANALLAVGEAATHTHLITLPDLLVRPDAEFRASALYDHPLTGAAITLLGILPPAGRREAPALRVAAPLLCLAALTAFGGRTALALALLWCILAAMDTRPQIARGPQTSRRASLPPLPILLAGGITLIGSFALMGQRLATHGAWDSSAQVRIDQFAILAQLNSTELMFGCSRDIYLNLLQTVNLAYGVDALENPWLLIFMFCGVVGFTVFALTLQVFLTALYPLLDTPARRMLLLQIALLTTSNSLAHKTTTLTVIIAYLVARAGACPIRSAPSVCLTPYPAQGAAA